MKRIKKYRLSIITCFVYLYIIDCVGAQENFEDADKLSDLMSGNNSQHFDLRHTIPGIPEVDYPIYSSVPKTSFECTGRHEGYYADIESRCQAFRICTHTARSVQGFGFLCPNGTLFSQKFFVCDWYRNVNCDDSERYYGKNDENRVGSSFDMMETVRQMMEYPMKTISKALQQNTGSSRKPTQRRGNNRGAQKVAESEKNAEVRTSGRNNTRKSAVTRAQVESAHSRGTTKYNKEKETTTKVKNQKTDTAEEKTEVSSNNDEEKTSSAISSTSLTTEDDKDVYVNSLGELSTDPGVHFDRTNAHIIAEPRRTYRYEKHMNFAAKVNAGLNDLANLPANESLAPDYVKSLRSTHGETTQIDLASNINSLLDEVANDLNPSTSGYQVQAPTKAKHAFRFLSRGFSSQNDPYKYQKPKQTASTIRFTPNELPVETEKSSKKSGLQIAQDAVPFGHSTTKTTTSTATATTITTSTTTTTTEAATLDSGIDYSTPSPVISTLEDISYLNPPPIVANDTESSIANNPSVTYQPSEEPAPTLPTTILPITNEAEHESTTASLDTPTYAALIDTTTTQASIIENLTPIPDVNQNLVQTQQQHDDDAKQKFQTDDDVIDEDRADAHKQAENLFLSGLQLTNNVNKADTPLLIQVADDHSYLTAWVTSTPPATVTAEPPQTTTTENSAESGSLKERIRNYRRLANLQRVTTKPLVYSKRINSRMTTKMSSTISTTPKPTTTTRSYLKRVAASRLRLSRLTAAAAAAAAGNKQHNAPPSNTNSLSPNDNAVDSGEKKISVRGIERETAIAGNGITDSDAAKNAGIVTWETVRNSLQRFQVNNKQTDDPNSNSYTTTPPTPAVSSSTTVTSSRNSLMRSRNRFANLKLSNLRNEEPTNISPSQAPPAANNSPISTSVSMSVSSPTSSNYNSPTSVDFLNANSLPVSSPPPSPTPTPQTLLALSPNSQIQEHVIRMSSNSPISYNGNSVTAENTNLNSNADDTTPNFISFDKLTRSIVDDSILQNYREGPVLGRSSLSSTAINAFQASSPRGVFNQVALTPSRPTLTQNSAVNYNSKVLAPAPTQHTPTTHRQTFAAPILHSAPTTPGPRIVVARAEGQRLEPNSVSSIITSLISQQQLNQPKPSPTTSYVPLNDFLSKKFGNQLINKVSTATQYQQQQPPISYQQQYQQNRPITNQPFQQQQQFQQQIYRVPQQNQYSTNQNHIHSTQHQQQQPPLQQQQHPIHQNSFYQRQLQPQTQPQTHINQPQSSQLTPQSSSSPSIQNIFATFQQQQQQLPQFPPLATQTAPNQQQISQFGGTNDYLNVPLPSLGNVLIPAPTSQVAQKRSDINFDGLELTDFTPEQSLFTGATSYDVPISSIGRLPNDITGLLRRLRRH